MLTHSQAQRLSPASGSGVPAPAGSAVVLRLLFAGWLLLWSAPGRADTKANDADWVHTVRPGETLIGVVDQWTLPGTDWRRLAALNRIRDPHRLQPGSSLRIPREWLREEPLTMDVLHAHGDVQVERQGETPAPLVGGMTVRAGDWIRTGRQSSVSLRSPDGSRVLLRENSTLSVMRHSRLGKAALPDTELRLETGAADTDVAKPPAGQQRPRLQIRTPVVNLGVRGTQFRTHAEDKQAKVEVLDGRVGAASATHGARNEPELAVQAGFGVRATAAGVEAPVSLPPAPSLQGLPDKVERLPLALQWQAAPAAGWRVQIYPQGQPDQVLLDGVFRQPQAHWPNDLPDGRYGLRLRAINEQGLEGHDSHHAFAMKARPEPPMPRSPAPDSRHADPRQTLSWTRQTEAARYRLQVADTPDFARLLVDLANLTEPHATVDVPEGGYHWRVASVRADGDTGPWSDAQRFARVARPAAPAAQAPEATADGQLLRWRATPGQRYQLQVSKEANFGSLLVDTTLDQAQWLLAKPEPGTYHLRVRGISADGFEGAFSSPQTLDIPAPPRPVWPWLMPLLFLLL